MSGTVACQVSPGEVWAAREEAGELTGLRIARDAAADAVGAVYLGRVVALRPELPAALIDIGLDRPGFLDARDADKKRGLAGLNEGAALLIEVIKATRADKAAGLRVLAASDPRRKPSEAAARDAKPPLRLDRPEPAVLAAAKALLDPALDRILVDDHAALAELRRALPDLAPRVAFHGAAMPLFDALGIGGQIDSLLEPRVALAAGGALTIETTRAATLIDVDGGGRGALAVNLDAARALARQIALRNLAGPIVIDFVGMKQREDRDKVAAALRETFTARGETPELLGWTRLGHFELVRARHAPSLDELLYERGADGSRRKTALTLALEALRLAAREAQAQPAKSFTVAAHPDIAAALEDGAGRAARKALERRLGRALVVEADPKRAREAIDIRAA